MAWPTGWAIRGSISDRAKRFFLSPKRANGLRARPALFQFQGAKAAGGVKLTIHLHLLPRLRIGGARPVLLVCGVRRDTFTFT